MPVRIGTCNHTRHAALGQISRPSVVYLANIDSIQCHCSSRCIHNPIYRLVVGELRNITVTRSHLLTVSQQRTHFSSNDAIHTAGHVQTTTGKHYVRTAAVCTISDCSQPNPSPNSSLIKQRTRLAVLF